MLRDVEKGSILVEWYIGVVKNVHRLCTWSMEQVHCTYTKKMLKKHGGCIVKMQNFGVHNNRKRVFLGNFTDFTQECNFSMPLTLYEVICECNETVPKGFNYQTAGALHKKKPGCYYSKDVNLLSCTVTGQFPKLFNKDTNTFKSLNLNIFSSLQTFPVGYIDHNQIKGRQMIGNSVPPKISKLLIDNL